MDRPRICDRNRRGGPTLDSEEAARYIIIGDGFRMHSSARGGNEAMQRRVGKQARLVNR